MSLAPIRPDLVWFDGDDAIRFLNDLISQEIAALAPGTVVRSLLLQPRGKLDHLLWVLRGEGRVGLVADPGRGSELAAKLGRYRIRVDVEIEEGTHPTWLMVGESQIVTGQWREESEGLIAGLPWNGPKLTLVTGERPSLAEFSTEEMDRIRIEAGEPLFGIDVDTSTIPQESGLVSETVDFTKGCFLGQELVARIDSRGRVNRHLRKLKFEGAAPETGSEIRFGDRVVGTLGSIAGDLGLALIRREVEPGETVEVAGTPAVVSG